MYILGQKFATARWAVHTQTLLEVVDMKPRLPQRAVWTSLLLVMFSWVLTSASPAQDKTPPDERTAKPVAQKNTPPEHQPVVRPSEPVSSAPTTYPATQAAQDRFENYRKLKEAAQQNGQAAAAPPASSQPVDDTVPNSQLSKEQREQRLAEMRADRAEARRKLLEKRKQRQDAAHEEMAGQQAATENEASAQNAGDEPAATKPVEQPIEQKLVTPPYGNTTWQPSKSDALEPIKRTETTDDGRKLTPLATDDKDLEVEDLPEPKDGRSYFISFVEMAWEDVITHYAKLVGKPLMDNGVIIGGELTYESERKFTKEGMLDELNFLLVEQGYFIVETIDYIYLVPLNELSKYIELGYIFDTVETFEQAQLRDYELCEVLIRIKDRPADDIRDMLSPSMPDYALPVVVGNTNNIKITGLARDVRRFMGLLDLVQTEDYDPRETRFIKVETNVRQIEKMIRDYFGAESATRRYNRETRKFETVGGESKLLIIPDERTKNLIIKATPAKLAEIEAFIKLIDEKPDIGEFNTHVITVQYGDATEIARLLNEILRQEEGEQSRARTPVRTTRTSRSSRDRNTPQRTAQPNTQAPAPEDIIVEDLYERAKKTVRIVADGRTNNLLVYANDDGLKRVNDILEKIDQPVPTNFKTFVLEHAKAEVIQPTVEQIIRGSLASSGRGGPTIIVDGTINALHVVADREDMARIEQIIKDFDIEIPEDEWHYVELTNITPSEAVRIIAPFLDGNVTSPRVGSRGGRRSTPARATSTAQTIPLDESNMLIVICSEEEWEKVDRVLKIADEQALSSKPEIQFFDIVNGNPESIADTITQLYGNYQHPVLGRSRTFVDTLGTQVVVQGVKPALEEVEALVKALDIKVEGRPLVILPLEHAEADDVLQKVQPLMGISGGGRRGRGGASTGGNSIQADAVTNSLIIQADPTTLEKVRQFITEYETKVAAQTPERKAYTLKHASSRDVMNAINSFFGSRSRGRQPTASRVSVVTVGNQVIVHAPKEMQVEVAALISELDELSDLGVTTLLVKMPGADIRSIAGRLTNAFRDQTRTQGVIARFEPDLSTETILMTCSKDVLAEAEDLLSQYKELAGELIWETTAYQLKHASADDTSRWLTGQLMSLMSQQMSSAVVHQIKVTPDMRTNRVFINAPQVAVKQGRLLLEQYDTPVEQQPVPPMEIWTENLPGLNVRDLSSQLQRNLNELMRTRTDRLRATVTADQLTNNLIITAPTDMKPKITELVASFAAQTEDLALVQKFVDIKEADANYVANQVRSILNVRMGARGSGVTSKINIQVDTRLNRVIMNAPKVAIEEAEALIAQLDQKSTADRQLQTIPLVNADANTVNGVLRSIFSEKIRARTLQVSVEPLTNSLIVGASKEDFEEIRIWAEELDTKAVSAISEPEILEFKNANPWEVYNVLNATFMQRSRGRTVVPGKEVRMSIIAGRSIVVQAPPDKLAEIKALAAKLDEIVANKAVVRTFVVPGMGAKLQQFAGQIASAVNSQVQAREQRISVTAYPPADVLIVTALEDQFEMIQQAMDQFKDLYEPERIETLALENGDANAVYQALSKVLQPKIRAGKIQLSVEGMTNSLIVVANEKDLAEIREWTATFDAAAKDTQSELQIIELKNANPWEVYNVLNATFLSRRYGGRVQPGKEIKMSIIAGRSIVVQAPPEKMKEIEALATKLDEIVANKAVVRTFVVPGMGAKLQQFAGQIASAVNSQVQAREQRISVTAYPPADVLIVTALEDQFEMIQQAMDQFKDLYEPERIETLALENGDANAVYQALSKVLQPKIRAGKIQLSVEGMTNSLIVVANEKDMSEIREWTATFDAAAKDTQSEPQIFELKNANPWEVYNVLNATFLSRRYGGRVQPGKEIKFSIVAGRSIVVQAPPEKMEDIANLITKLDEIGDNKAQVRTYEMAGMGSKLNDFARQLQNAMNSQASGREQRVTITPYPPADTLIVMALEEQFEQVEQMMEKLKPLMDVAKSKTEFFKLEYVDAGQIVNLVRDLVQKRTQAGGKRGSQDFSVSADPRTNRLIVFAPETILPDVRAVVQELDIEIADDDVFTIELQYADPWEVRNMINDVFGNRGRRSGDSLTEQVYVTVSNSTLIVKAPPKKLEQIQELLAKIDIEDFGGMTVKTYSLKVLNAQTVAGQVQAFLRSMGSVSKRGQMQPGAFAEPTTNTLVVIAPPSRLPFIEGLITQIEALGEGETATTETYVLNYARADQAQRHVDQMLQAKVAEAEGSTRGRNTQQKTVVMADTESNRLFVFAQQKYQKLAADMIKMIDQDIDTGEIVHIIRLENADSAQLAQTVTQTMQGGGGGRSGRGTAPMKVKVVADAGSNSILLSGLPKDVAEIETLINDLEVTYDTIPELQYFELDYALAYDVAEALRNIFPPGRNQSDDVNVTEDEYYNKILVTTNRRKMRQVEAIVKQLDLAPEDDGSLIAGGKEIYFVEVFKGDPFDISWDVSDLLPPSERGGPSIEADLFGEYIQVICRPNEFPRIERLIRQFDNKAKPEIVVRARQFLGDKQQLIQYLQERQYDFLQEQSEQPKLRESIIIDLHPEGEEQTNQGSKPAPATSRLSGVAPRPLGGFILTTLFQDTPEIPASNSSVEPPPVQATTKQATSETDVPSEPPQRQLPAIQMMPDGRMILRGPRDAVDEIEDAIDLFEEDLSRGEVIRIFRFKYGDVNAASRILDMMFNTRQVRVPQQQQRQGQQGQQRGGQQGGKDGQQQDERQSIMQQAMQMMGGRGGQQGGTTGGTQIRIATDASHNYIIVKCDEALLPDIIQLLRELDISPSEVDVQVIQLKNLEATETANNIKQVLGISGTSRSARPQQQAAGRNQQQQLMEMIQQQMVSIGGEASAKVESVEIVPNSITNSLLVSAPNDVMEIIKDVIGRLESLEGGDITVIKHYTLKTAKVEDVLPLLQELFGAAGGSGGGRGGRGGGGSSPADLGQVTISGDPRNNTIIYVAQAKDVETVNEQIEKLDIEGALAEVEMYVCKYGDATGIAQVVQEMFAATGGQRGGGRRGAATTSTNTEVRITAEPATNTILVFAPQEKRELIFSQIEKLDRENKFEIREIPVVFARPSKITDKLLQIFGGSGGATPSTGGGRRGGARTQAQQTVGRIVVIPDENAKKLLVRAPDEVFSKMIELVELIDQPNEQLLIRTFPLAHADASIVVDSVKAALAEFMQIQRQLGGEDLDIDAFTAVADPRTNSVVVVGSEETFLFVGQMLTAIDSDIPADREKQFRIFVLDRSDAQIVADAINSFASGSAATSSGGGGRRGGRGAAPASGTGPILDVQAIADTITNSVMVYGRLNDIAKIEQDVIAKMEGALSDHLQFATIELKEAVPSQLIPFIQQFLDRATGTGDTRGGGSRNVSTASMQGPQLLPNDNAGTIEIYGSARQIEEVKTLAARFDSKDLVTNGFDIIPVPWGQDPFTLAATVQDLVNASEQEVTDRTGRQARFVTVSADEHSNAIIAFGDPSQLALVKTVVGQLQEIRPEKPVTRVIELVNLSSAEAEQLISDLQSRRTSSGSRGTSIRRPSSSGSRNRSTPSRNTGGSNRSGGSRRRSMNWNQGPNAQRFCVAPAGIHSPLLGTTVLLPRVLGLFMSQDQDQPAAEPPPAKQTTVVKSATPREQEQQKMLSSISGQLRGEVVATPLDSRRIIVTGDQEDVDFVVQMLLMMEKSTPAPVIEVFTLQNTQAAAIAPVLEETLTAMIETGTGGSGDRIDNFSIIAEGRSNTIIASASETNMDLIAELIVKLDVDSVSETEPKIVPLKHIRASEAVQLLEDPIKRMYAIRGVPADSQATVQAVERSNAVMVIGTRPDVAEIEKLINGLDIELPPEDDFSTAKVTIVDLMNAEAETLAETLTELIAMEKATNSRGRSGTGGTDMPLLRKLVFTLADGVELPPIDLDKPIVITPEQGRNSLVIYSSEKNAVALLEIVKLFDSLPKGEEVEVKSFALAHANAEQVADLLEKLFDEGRKALVRPSDIKSDDFDSGVMPPVPPGLAGRGLPYNVVVNFDQRSNTVIVIGRKDAVLLAAGMVTELDRPSVDLAMKPYIIQLKNIQATTLKEKLDDLLNERLDALGDQNNLARDSAITQADDRSNTLIVLASPELYTMVADLATQLDQAEPYSVVDSEFRRLIYADAAKLAGLLQELFDKKKEADNDVTEGGQKNILYVFADARSNSLMLTGTRDYLVEANSLVDNLDQAFDPTVQFKLRTIRLNSAANIAQLLDDMIQASRADLDNQMQGTPIHVAADPYSNSLLLAASAEDMLMIERWIDVLDRPSEPGRITRIIPLRRGDAQQLAQSAQDLFETQVSGADKDLTVTYDESTNSVIVIGPPAVVKDIESFIEDFNKTEGQGAIVRIFKLEQADAEDAGALLRSVLDGKGGSVGGGSTSGGSSEEINQVMLYFQREHPEVGVETLKGMRKEIVVIDDLRTNSLVVTAPPESMPLMESLVAAVDVPPDAAKIRVFKLRNSDAEEMVTMLEELFTTDQNNRGSNTQELQLTMGDVMGGRQQLAFTTDARTNSVIAAGTTGYLDLVDELVLKLDSEPIQDRKTIVYQPSNNQATNIQQAIKEYSDAEQQRLNELSTEISVSRRQEREIIAIANEETNRMILDYDPRRESDVLEMVRDLDQPPPQVMIQVLIVEVTVDNSLELGVEFAFQDLQYTKAGTTDTNTFDFVGGTDIGAAGTGLGGFTFTITGADFNFLVRTLQNEGSLNILSRPQIAAMDNQQARIEITNDVPYVSSTSTSSAGQITTSVARQDVGIILEVTPHINPDGFVRMEIRQEVSDLTGSTIDVGQGVTAPIFFKREAETTVTVKDSETVVLGGLITSREENREQKIPILGDIPILGTLFSNRSNEFKRTELLVVLTPRVVWDAESYRELSLNERDRTSALSGELLSNELMERLRVTPEDLKPDQSEELIGPFPKTQKSRSIDRQPTEQPEERYNDDDYGPIPAGAASERLLGQAESGDPDSYDIPVSWARADSTAQTRRSGYE